MGMTGPYVAARFVTIKFDALPARFVTATLYATTW